MSDETTNTANLKTLRNGAIYDMNVKRIVKGASLSSVDAANLRAKRTEKRRQIVREAANQMVQDGQLKATYGDDAFIAAIVQTAMMKATEPEDPKSIEAAKFILQEAGETDKQAQTDDLAPGELHVYVRGMVETWERLLNSGQISQPTDTIEADVADFTPETPTDAGLD